MRLVAEALAGFEAFAGIEAIVDTCDGLSAQSESRAAATENRAAERKQAARFRR
jgi:hypothetical protein